MKYEKILNDTWEYLENNYKGSEISIELWAKMIEQHYLCNNNYCLKQCIKLLWQQWEWFDFEERNYFKDFLKNKYGVKVV